MAHRRLKVGLIGTGHIGRLHAEDLARRVPNAELRVVADVFVDAARQCADRLDVPEAVEDYHAILDNREIEAVVICSPSDTHGRIIGEAAAVGKHVFCEKPIDYELAKIDAALGDLDTVVITLSFTNGVIGTIDNCRHAVYGYDQRLELFGSGGSISVGNNFPDNAVLSTGDRISRDLPHHFFTERYVEAYTAEMRAFVDAVLQDRPVPVTGLDGRIPVVMALAAQWSVREGRPVRLDEVESRSP